jgi:hypothetical protein
VSPAALAERRVLSLWDGDDHAHELALPGVGPEREEVTATAAVRSLEAAVDGAWSALATGFAADCLLCGGAVHPRWSAGAGVVGGRCADCGTEID